MFVQGPNYAKAGAAGDRVAEAVISGVAAPAVTISATGASLEGFRLENVTSTETHATGAAYTAMISVTATGTVSNNIVVGQPTGSDAGPNGIVVTAAGASTVVSGNWVKDVMTTNRSGIKLAGASCQVLRNKVTDTAYNGIAFEATGTADFNTVERCLQAGLQGASAASYTFTNNTITGTNSGNNSKRGGINITANASGATIQYNTLTNNGVSGIAYREDPAAVATELVNYNNFKGNNGVGLFMGRSGNVDAKNNYWNNAGGPTATGADAVLIGANGGTVTTDPYATTQFPNASVTEWFTF